MWTADWIYKPGQVPPSGREAWEYLQVGLFHQNHGEDENGFRWRRERLKRKAGNPVRTDGISLRRCFQECDNRAGFIPKFLRMLE